MVVIDEIFDALDSQGVEAVVNSVDAIFPDDIAVYVISHNAELKAKFDTFVKVTNTDGISSISSQ